MRDGDSAAKILSVVLLCAVLAPCSGCMWDLPGSISYVDGKYVDSEAGKKRGVIADWRVAPHSRCAQGAPFGEKPFAFPRTLFAASAKKQVCLQTIF